MRCEEQAVTENLVARPATGRSSPLGATLLKGGANSVIPIGSLVNRTYHYWHVFLPGVEAGQIYGFRAQGAVTVPRDYSREAARLKGDNSATAMKSVVTDPQAYDWEDEFRDMVKAMHRAGIEVILDAVFNHTSEGCGFEGPTDDSAFGCCSVRELLIERRILRDVAQERWRETLTEALSEIKPAWHGVKLDQPDWSSFSHSVVIGGEFVRRETELLAMHRYRTGSAL